jgi:Holliday junction resolvase RusA-like endonuclease
MNHGQEKIQFFIAGIPQPGGSKRAFKHPSTGRIIVTDDAKHNREWRANVSFFARQHFDAEPMRGPLLVCFEFVMPRIGAHMNSKGQLKTSAPKYHTVRPDATKLTRSTEDALTGILWADDSQVMPFAIKRYGSKPGCLITVTPLQNQITEQPQGSPDVDAPLFETLLGATA